MPTATTTTATETRECIREDFLSCTAGLSDKGYVLRIYKDGPARYYFYTNYGPRSSGMTRNTREPVFFNNEAAANTAYTRKLTTELGKGYVRCLAGFIGCRNEMGTINTASVTTTPSTEDPVSLWTPFLYTTTTEEGAVAAISNPNLIFQRKYDGERMRLFFQEGQVKGCNRRGLIVEVSSELREAAVALRSDIGTGFDFDGERLGTNRYVIWDNTGSFYSQPYVDRFRSILMMAESMPPEFNIAETAFTTERKREMLERAKHDGWEGIMVKRRTAPYFAGRSMEDWKYPFTAVVTVRFVGVNVTSTTAFGSLKMEIRTGENSTVPAGNVAGGFRTGQIREIAERIDAGEVILGDIRYKNWTGSALYQPKFIGLRTDLTWADCINTHLRGARQTLVPVVGA